MGVILIKCLAVSISMTKYVVVYIKTAKKPVPVQLFTPQPVEAGPLLVLRSTQIVGGFQGYFLVKGRF